MDKEVTDVPVEAGLEKTDGGFALWGKINHLINLPRQHSLWYFLFSPACCAIELMQTGGPRTDLDRFGMVFRSTPRQSDLMIVGGTVSYKMAERIKLLYDQMAEPKYVISMGSCANCGGMFQKSYSILKGIDMILPVDIYIPGCPPRPEALANAMMKIQQIINKEDWLKKRRPCTEPEPQKGKGGIITRL